MVGDEVDIDKEVDKVDNTEEKKGARCWKSWTGKGAQQLGGDESEDEGEGVDGEVEVNI